MSSKKVLFGASNYGVWAEELQAPWDAVREAGHTAVLATPQAKKPLPLAASVDPNFVDPIQKYNVNPANVCTRVKQILASGEWDYPIRLSDARMDEFDALVLAGGLGADLDLTNNPAVHRLVLEAYKKEKLICAICFSVAALAFTRDPDHGYRSVLFGRKATAHPRSWDFVTDVTYDLYEATAANAGTNVVTPGFVLPIQDVVTDAVGPQGNCYADPTISRAKPSVVFDRPFITACSVESSIAFGEKIVEVLAKP